MKHEGRHFSISGVQVTKRVTEIPLMLGGNTEQGAPAGRRGSATAGSRRARRRSRSRSACASELQRLRAESDRADEPFKLVFRMEGADPATARRYADEGFEEVLIWTDQVWPADEPLAGEAVGDVRRRRGARRPEVVVTEPVVSTVVDIVRQRRGTDDPAITFEDRTTSFRQLAERASRVAQAFVAAGVGAGDRIAFLDKNRPEYFDIVFGAAKVGAVCVAVNWRLSPREIAFVLEDAGAKVLFVGAELAPLVEKIEDELHSTTFVALDDHPRWPSFAAWTAGHDAVDPGYEPDHDTVALQLYTSGTTGLPKGAMLTNGNLFAMAAAAGPMWGFRPGMVSLGVSPLFHIAGSGWNLMVMAAGGHVVLQREVDAEAILRGHPPLRRHPRPARARHPADDPGPARGRGAATRRSLETVVYGASPISDDVLLALFDAFDCDFVQGYGLTETSGAVTVLPAEDHDRARPELLRSCGRPLPGVELRIVDPETGVDCEEGTVGEVLIRSAQVMAGYWNRPEATAEAITVDGWFHSGDAGFLRDGRLYLHDRIKDMIVSGAENVYPAEVENVLMRHDAVVDAAVIGVPDERWGEAVKAVVVLEQGADVSSEDLIAFARNDLAHYKCPTLGRRRRRAAPQSGGQGAEAGAARALLGRARPPHRRLTALNGSRGQDRASGQELVHRGIEAVAQLPQVGHELAVGDETEVEVAEVALHRHVEALPFGDDRDGEEVLHRRPAEVERHPRAGHVRDRQVERRVHAVGHPDARRQARRLGGQRRRHELGHVGEDRRGDGLVELLGGRHRVVDGLQAADRVVDVGVDRDRRARHPVRELAGLGRLAHRDRHHRHEGLEREHVAVGEVASAAPTRTGRARRR